VFAGLTPWGERLIIEIMPPKPDVPSHPVPYRLLNRRCSYHDCNRLYATAERSNKPTFDRSILANDRWSQCNPTSYSWASLRRRRPRLHSSAHRRPPRAASSRMAWTSRPLWF